MLCLVNLQVVAQDDMLLQAEVVERVAPKLLRLGQKVAVACHQVLLCRLVVLAPIAREVVTVGIPNVGIFVEIGVLALRVVDHRVALHLILLVAHLHLIDRHQLLAVREVVAALRLHDILTVRQHTATPELADVILRVEAEVGRIERGIAIDDLHQLGVDPHLVDRSVVVGPLTVHVGRVLIDEHIAEALHTRIGVAHRTVAGDDRSVVLCRHVAHQEKHRIPRGYGAREIRLEVDDLLLCLAVIGCNRPRTRSKEHRTDRRQRNTYRENPAHAYSTHCLFSNSPSRKAGSM